MQQWKKQQIEKIFAFMEIAQGEEEKQTIKNK